MSIPTSSEKFLESHSEESGDVVGSEEHTLHRGLEARQISMIALGGAVGTGLIIGSGTALQRGGPLGLFLGYSYVGFTCYLVMVSLGEMAAYLPHKKGFAGYATRFVDPALGFALGWNYLLKYWIVTPNNLNAAGLVIRYWTQDVNTGVWMAIFIVFIFAINMLGVRVFGEMEFWFSSIKVISLIGLMLMSIVFDLGGNPKHDRIGFRNWKPPSGPMGTYLLAQVGNRKPLSTFLGFWSVMINALFAYIGTELIGVTVGEAANPRRNIPIAIRRTFFRIVVFYVGGVFLIGLVVPSTDPTLFIANKAKTGAAASPFVVAATLVGAKTVNHVINAAILIFVLSAANSDLYIGSRTLYALALEGKAPSIFRRVNRLGVPWPALLMATLWCCIVFINLKTSGSKVFGWFTNLVSTFGAITWMCILYSHIRFMKALKLAGISRDSLPYKAPFQPYGAWFALINTGIITLFKGFDSFMPFVTATFATSYVGIPAFIFFYFFWKILHRTRTIPIKEIDLFSGKREIDLEEERYLAEQALKGPPTGWKKLWDAL
ncbi:putative DIP5-glutamate and aspartate permease [Hysterangium stoloniferum]|nr:putative DIP5-glutamate and aspartate permease [Hysterangium stoloniferum]